MKIGVLTLFPEMFNSFVETSIIGRACEKGLINIEVVDIRNFSNKKHRNVDDSPYGGGAGMVMLAQPIVDCVRHMRSNGYKGKCYYLNPRGETFCQQKVLSMQKESDFLLLCGHYEGIDQRAIDLVVDEEISIGDFVLTGGELPAMLVIDAVSRYVEGVLNNESTEEESFSTGLLEYPHYTRPATFEGLTVPSVLLEGNHAHIQAWRTAQSLETTYHKRPDLYKKIKIEDDSTCG